MDTNRFATDSPAHHPGLRSVFQAGPLTLGFVSPAEGYPDSP